MHPHKYSSVLSVRGEHVHSLLWVCGSGQELWRLFGGIIRKGLSDEVRLKQRLWLGWLVWGGEWGRREERTCIKPHAHEEAQSCQNRPGLGMSGPGENMTATVGNQAGQAAKTSSRTALLPWLSLDICHWWQNLWHRWAGNGCVQVSQKECSSRNYLGNLFTNIWVYDNIHKLFAVNSFC